MTVRTYLAFRRYHMGKLDQWGDKIDEAEPWIDRTLGRLMGYGKTARVVFIVALVAILISLIAVAM